MAKQSKDEKRTKNKKQKLKKQRAKKAATPAILRRDPLLAEALRHHHPLHSCLINENWQDMKIATIFVVRKTPTGLVMVNFLVDLLGFGLKDVVGDYGFTLNEMDSIKSQSAEEDLPLESCDLPFASSIIHGGIAWAKKWGIKLPGDYNVWMRILDPLDTDEIDLDLFGEDGKPLFMFNEDDDFLFDEPSSDLKILKDPLDIGESGPSRKQLERIGNIKGALIEFAMSPEFKEDFNKANLEYFKEATPPEDMEKEELVSFLDWYILEWQSESEDTFPDKFVETHGALMSRDVREMILGWRNVIHGIFEVKGQRSDEYHMKNLINEREYVVYPTASMAEASSFKIGDFINARVAPIGDFHTFSGIVTKIPCDGSDKERGDIYRFAFETQTRYPRKAFKDNEEKLKASMELLQKNYNDFIDYIGTDELIGTGREMAQKYRDFLRYDVFEKRNPETGLSKAEKYEKEERKTYKLPQINFPETLLKQSGVGMLFDPAEGISFLERYDLFVDIFSNPDRYIGSFLGKRKMKDIIMDYLESDSISDMPFRKMAKRFPDNFARVMEYVLNWEGFSLDMIDELLLHYKPQTFDKIPAYVAVLDSEMIKFTYAGEK
ncbi:MAG: hypothetical protein U9M96_05815 [Thermodesulfobacteriota bacterium]|nr:hypothetical protein [Thermodesulfobacteriota bacterium]